MLKVDCVFFENDNMAKIYERVFSTIIAQGKKNGESLDPQSQTLSGEDSTWMVDRLEIPCIVGSVLLVFPFLIR